MSKKVYVLLAEGFELIEAMIPVDVLRRGGVEVLLFLLLIIERLLQHKKYLLLVILLLKKKILQMEI